MRGWSLRALLGWVLGCLVRVWLGTLRLELEVHPALSAVTERPWVLVFFHGTQWPLLAWRRRRPTVVLVSLSGDGELQRGALSALGLTVVRGSSSRGGARGLAAIVRRLRSGTCDAAFAVDGPRGPYGVAKPGALLAARAASAVLVTMGSAVSRGATFARAWDRFALAWPFSRVSVVLGPPILGGADEAALSQAIAQSNEAAAAILAARRARVVRSPRTSRRARLPERSS